MKEITEFASKLWSYHFLNQPLTKADCIVGLGSYDLRVAERCAELYSEKFAPYVIFSGMCGNWTKNQKDNGPHFPDHIPT